jgi:hypothetical protein
VQGLVRPDASVRLEIGLVASHIWHNTRSSAPRPPYRSFIATHHTGQVLLAGLNRSV